MATTFTQVSRPVEPARKLRHGIPVMIVAALSGILWAGIAVLAHAI